MQTKILIINGGSSSLKFQLLTKTQKLIAKGIAERIGIDGIFTLKTLQKTFNNKIDLKNHQSAIAYLLEKLKKHDLIKDFQEIVGIGHRVVQGGEIFKKSTIITSKNLQKIRDLGKLAPLHNPCQANIIEAFLTLCPKAINIATFDTSFHQSMQIEQFYYSVPKDWYKKYHVRRYGMHGTSHKYVTLRMQQELKKDNLNLVSLHLGNGSSLCAIKNSKSYNTSMGLTPLAGVVMGTRSGNIDPAIVGYMSQQLNKSAQEIIDILNNESGLKAISQISSDMRDIEKSQTKNAQLAIQIWAKKIATYLIDYLNQIGPKVDAIVFTAGIGENAPDLRQVIIEQIKLIKLQIDKQRNWQKFDDLKNISTAKSLIPIYVVRTNEEKMIANDLLKLLS